MTEKWKPIKGYEGSYEVSNHGRVRSLDRMVPYHPSPTGRRFVKGKILKPFKTGRGIMQINLSDEFGPTAYGVHTLVADAFKGRPDPRTCPGGICVMHRDGDKTNNHVDNLRYARTVERANRASRAATRSLTNANVRTIKTKLKQGVSGKELAKRYGVSQQTISRIKLRDTYIGTSPYDH